MSEPLDDGWAAESLAEDLRAAEAECDRLAAENAALRRLCNARGEAQATAEDAADAAVRLLARTNVDAAQGVVDQLKALRANMRSSRDALDHVYVRGCAEGLRQAETVVRRAFGLPQDH